MESVDRNLIFGIMMNFLTPGVRVKLANFFILLDV